MDIPIIEPTEFTAGDTVSWDREDLTADFSALDGWSLTYTFNGPASFQISATPDEDHFHVRIPAADSAGYPAGDYWWEAYVSKGSERYKVDWGMLTIKANLQVVAGEYDGRSIAQKTLDNLKDVFYKLSTKGFASISAEGRSWTKERLSDLIDAIHEAQAMVERENAIDRRNRGLGTGRKILTRFVRPS